MTSNTPTVPATAGVLDPATGEHVTSVYRIARAEPDRPAVVDASGRSLTYGQLVEAADGYARGLRELGLRTGDCLVLLAPNGIGVLYGRTEMLAELPPARTGGSSIMRVTMDTTSFLPPPLRFEAGTQPVSQVIGLGEAARYLASVGMDRVAASEEALLERLVAGINANPGLRLLGPQGTQNRVALASVEVLGVHAHDVGQVLDGLGVQVRVGHHCAQPLHRALGITSSVRASMHLTTTPDEIDRFLEGLRAAQQYFGVE